MVKGHVLVVENDSFLRDLIANSLRAFGFTVSVAANYLEARQSSRQIEPEIVVLDVDLGDGPNGFEFAFHLRHSARDVAIVFLSNLPDARFIDDPKPMVPGRVAYLHKQSVLNCQHLVNTINAVLLNRVTTEHRHDLHKSRPFARLSQNQLSVLKMVAQGFTNQQIAAERKTTIRAVEAVIGRIYLALGIDVSGENNARVDATRIYVRSLGRVSNAILD